MLVHTLYKHTFPNGKVYIGITKMEPEKRWANGRGYRKPCRIAYAIEKYGWENIKHEIVLQTESQEFVEQEEIRYINEVYHSNDKRFGYNIASGGYSSLEGVSNRGLRLYNNGKIQRYFTEPPMDSQWKLGYLPETKEKYRISAAVGAEKLRGAIGGRMEKIKSFVVNAPVKVGH